MKNHISWFIIFFLLFSGLAGFADDYDYTKNIFYQNKDERPQNLEALGGSWKSSNEDYLHIYGNMIHLGVTAQDEMYWESVAGIFKADEKRLSVIVMNHNSPESKEETSARNVTILYEFPEYEVFPPDFVTITYGKQKILFERENAAHYSQRRQTELNGVWEVKKTWNSAADMNVRLQIEEETFLATLEGESFIFELLGNIFYENGMMSILKTDDTSSFLMEDFWEPMPGTDYSFEDIFAYAHYYELPEYIFFASAYDLPYRALLGYEQKGKNLILNIRGKKITLKKVQ